MATTNQNSGSANLQGQAARSIAEAQLLQALVQSEMGQDLYPTQPNGAYLGELEAQMEWEVSETASQAFFSRMDALWAAQAAPAAESSLLVQLRDRFAGVPEALLAGLVKRASELVDSQLSAVDRLVSCVDEFLPQWQTDDLLVLARPLAVSMRSGTTAQMPVAEEWETLSEMEKVRLALALANWIMTEMKHQPPSNS
jgi:hypothetical protein